MSYIFHSFFFLILYFSHVHFFLFIILYYIKLSLFLEDILNSYILNSIL